MSPQRGIRRRARGATLDVLVSEATTAQRLFVAPRRPGALIDASIAAAAMGGTLLLLSQGSATRHLDLLGVLLAAGTSLPLLLWRRAPLGVFALSTAASASLMALGYQAGPPLGPTAALFLLAASRDETHPWTRRTTATVCLLLAIHVGALGLAQGTFPGTNLVAAILLWTIAWFAGERTRLRRAEVAELKQRALRNQHDAERERRLAAAEERARIARDLHDSAGHAINVIGVQASAARLWHERDPARSRTALQTIENVARQTVGEIDRIVHTLRSGDIPNGQVEAPPGLAALGTLITQHAAAGLVVTRTTEGEPRPLTGTVDQAAYRILQEALTNAARHGAGGAQVGLRFGASALQLTVINPTLTGDPISSSDGHGLVGMRERATLLGGELEIERADGSFHVHAELPYGDQPQ
jgi:signal transduction histidine kinase